MNCSVSCGTTSNRVPDDSVIGYAENGGVGVFVDRDNDAGLAHASQMLDGAADAAGDVELRRDGFAGLPDLQRVIAVAGIAGAARGSNRTAEQL